MESATSRQHAERARRRAIKEQIQNLQAQLGDDDDDDDDTLLRSPKRKKPLADATLLVPTTPSPRKKRRIEGNGRKARPDCSSSTRQESGRSLGEPASAPLRAKPAPSNVLRNLAALRPRPTSPSERTPFVRSSDLAEKPRPNLHCGSPASTSFANRDENLAIVEDLQIGPADHKPPPDDPLFDRLEPNSGIHLLSRSLPHEDLQEYLRGRYYLSPSRLYSCIRLLPNKSGYDIPVDSDWVTIAVVAERGPIKLTRAPVGITPGDNGAASDDETGGSKPGNNTGRKKFDKKDTKGQAKPHGKKFVSMKLIDFGARTRSSAPGATSTIRGDAFLTLLLFESDGFDKLTGENGSVKKIYQGGSKGAFEAMSKLKEGDVVALLNPKVLKPLQRNDQTPPHPVNNVLAVTPESAASMSIIGRARDLGMCRVLKKDGKVCGSWTDKRVSEVCEWHLTNAVQRQRAGRAEFSVGTSGMMTSARKRKPEYDPSRQWGLQPEPVAASSVYVVSGHVVGGTSGDMFTGEKLGRDAQEKAKRRLGKDSDKELKVLLETYKKGKKPDLGKGKGKGRAEEASGEHDERTSSVSAKPAYSANVIKCLGFDPAAKAGRKRAEDLSVQKKLEALEAVQGSRREIQLSRRPGTKIRSGVSVPAFMTENDGVRGDERDSDLDVLSPSGGEGMVNLDEGSD